jgi:hypothetical protein
MHKQNTNNFGWSFREWRLAWQHAGAAGGRPGDFKEDITKRGFDKDAEKLRVLRDEVEKALDLAAMGVPEYEALLKDDERARTIKALPEYFAGVGVKWYTHVDQIDTATLEEFKNALDAIAEAKRRAHDAVVDYSKSLEGYKQEAGKALADDALKEADKLGSLRNAKRVLDGDMEDTDVQGFRQHVLIDIARELVVASRQDLTKAQAKAFVVDLFNDDIRLKPDDKKLIPNVQGDLIKAIEKHVTTTKLDESNIRKVLEVLQVEADLPPEEVSDLREKKIVPLINEIKGLLGGPTLGGAIAPPKPRNEVLAAINSFFGDPPLTDAEKVQLVAEPDILLKEINKIVDWATRPADPLGPEESRQVLSFMRTIARDRLSLRFAERDIAVRALAFESDRLRTVMKRFPRRSRDLYLTAGGKPDALIKRFTGEDQRMDLHSMQIYLEQLQPEGVGLTIIDPGPPPTEKVVPATLIDLLGVRAAGGPPGTHFENYDDEKLTELSDAHSLDKIALQNVAASILMEGRFTFEVSDIFIHFGRSTENILSAVKWFYGAEIAKRMEEEIVPAVPAAGITPAECREFLLTHLPHLVMDERPAKQLIDCWDQEKFEEYLDEKLNFANPPGLAVYKALRRSGIVDDLDRYLDKNDLDVDLGSLHAFAHFDEFDTVPAAGIAISAVPNLSRQIIDLVQNPKNPKAPLDAERLKNIMMFLLGLTEEEADAKLEAAVTAGIAEKVGDEFYLVDGKRDDAIALLDAETISKEVSDLIKSLRGAKLHDIKGAEKLKLRMREFLRLAKKVGTSKWESAKESLRIFSDPDHDPALKDDIDRERAFGNFDDVIEDILSDFERQDGTMDSVFKDLMKYDMSQHELLLELSHTIPLSRNTRLMVPAATSFLAKQDRIERELDHLLKATKSQEVRIKARFIANLPGVDESIERARRYLENPATFALTPEEEKKWQGFLNEWYRGENEDGKNVLLPLEKELKVRVMRNALVLLENTQRPDGTGSLLVGDTHFDRWLEDPEHAKLPLQTILQDIDGSDLNGKDALIRAFCDGEEVTLPNGEILRPGDAKVKVELIQRRLQFQRDLGYAASFDQLSRNERFTQPLDVLRAGAESIGNMLRSGDRVQQGLAMAMLISGGYALLKGWREKDHFIFKHTKKVLVGLPLLFGADHVVKDMTGKGVLQRLGLTYMSPEDANAATELFTRDYENKAGFEDLGKDIGFAARELLMNEKDPVSVAALLAWRDDARSGRQGGKIWDKAPDQVKAGIGRLVSKMGTMDRKKYPKSDLKKEYAYNVALKTFEALCLEVATQRKETKTVGNGMGIIRGFYVNFDDPLLRLSGYDDEMAEFAKTRPGGGFSMLDVLVYERPTPAMRELVIQNPTFLEWAFHGSKTKLAEAIDAIKNKAVSPAMVIMHHLKESTPEAIDIVVDATSKAFEVVWDYLRLTGVKLVPALKEGLQAQLQTLTSIGWSIVETGKKLSFKLADGTIDIGGRALEGLVDFYDWAKSALPGAHPVLQSLEETIAGMDELTTIELEKKLENEFDAMVSMYSNQRKDIVRDARGRYTISDRFPGKRTAKINMTDPAGNTLKTGVARGMLKRASDIASGIMFGKDYELLLPSQQFVVLMNLQATFYGNLASNPAIQAEITRFETVITGLETLVTTADTNLSNAKKDLKDARANLKRLQKMEAREIVLNEEEANLLVRDATIRRGGIAAGEQDQLDDIQDRLRAIALEKGRIGPNIAGRINQQELDIPPLVTAESDAKKDLELAEENLKDAQENGTNTVNVSFSSLIRGLSADTLADSASVRKSNLFGNNVRLEDREIYGIPLSRLLDDPKNIAFKEGAQNWKDRRLRKDVAYRNAVDAGTENDITASYEAMLEQFALNQVFRLALLTTNDTGLDEGASILHLSVREGSDVEEYLLEREGPITYRNYRDVFNSVKGTPRRDNLP